MAWSDIFLPSGYQTADQAQANEAAQAAKVNANIAAGDYQPYQVAQINNDLAQANNFAGDQNAAAAGGFTSGLFSVFTGSNSNNNGDTGPGLGTVLKDVFILALIGGAIWAFVEFGGAGYVRGLSKKFKYTWLVVIAVGGLIAWYAYSTLKKTGSDTSGVVSNVFTNPLKSLFG